MLLRFGKLHCLGDDLMLVELLGQHAQLDTALVERWASRLQGVGFRRLVVIEIPRTPEADFNCRVLDRNGRELDARVADLCAALYWIHHQKLSNQPAVLLQCRQGLLRVSHCEAGWIAVEIEQSFTPEADLAPLPEALQQLLHSHAAQHDLSGQGQQLLVWSDAPPAQRLPRLLQPLGRRLRGWQLLWAHAREDSVQVQHWQQERSESGVDPVLLVADWLCRTWRRPAVRVEWQQESLLLEFGNDSGMMRLCAAVNLAFEGQIQA